MMEVATKNGLKEQLVYTEKENCRVCYTCVRECPAKAIRIHNGQAEIIDERCIGCGNCVRVCSQGAKVYRKSTDQVKQLIASGKKIAACIAPSFPAEFDEIEDYRKLVGMIREIGFSQVFEVGFGADLVAKEYNNLLFNGQVHACISSDCPSIVNYIEKYYPDLVKSMVPVVSPMVATARAVRKKYDEDLHVVFIGPCVAKKGESAEIDAVLTYVELRELFADQNIRMEQIQPSDFDPPYAGKGSLFPISRGLFQNILAGENDKEEQIIVAEGKEDFRELIAEFEKGLLSTHHLELLCCPGCIMGPGTSPKGKRYNRRIRVKNYVQNKLETIGENQPIDEFEGLDLSQQFSLHDSRLSLPSDEEITDALQSMNKFNREDELNCGACGYETCFDHAVAIVQGLAEKEMCLPYSIEQLHESLDNLHVSNKELASAREALKQSEKLASMGQLSAGIAHELNNPLGVITMYSNILKDEAGADNPMVEDLQLIVEQAERCKNIVGGLLNFARKNQVKLEETAIDQFTRRSLDSIIKPENITINFSSKLMNPKARIDPDQMMQVLTNLERNAIDAMPEGGELFVELSETKNDVIFIVRDNGTGIREKDKERIFTPFFTTKEAGKGTGLGLPLIYGIVKMHKGQIKLESNADPENGPTGTEFRIIIPRNI